MQQAAVEFYIALQRPTLDPEMRPALVRLPDAVRFPGWIEKRGKILVVVSAKVVADAMNLDRPPLWRDLDALWQQIFQAVERKARAGRFDPEPDARTGLSRIVLASSDLQPAS